MPTLLPENPLLSIESCWIFRRTEVTVDRALAPLIGIDLVEPHRLEQRLARTPTLRETLFTPREIAYCRDQTSPVEHLAARLCAKEAVVKALGLAGWDPLDIELVGGGDRLTVVLKEGALQQAQNLEVIVTVSMTHLADVAGAVALAMPRAMLRKVRHPRGLRSLVRRRQHPERGLPDAS